MWGSPHHPVRADRDPAVQRAVPLRRAGIARTAAQLGPGPAVAHDRRPVVHLAPVGDFQVGHLLADLLQLAPGLQYLGRQLERDAVELDHGWYRCSAWFSFLRYRPLCGPVISATLSTP